MTQILKSLRTSHSSPEQYDHLSSSEIKMQNIKLEKDRTCIYNGLDIIDIYEKVMITKWSIS